MVALVVPVGLIFLAGLWHLADRANQRRIAFQADQVRIEATQKEQAAATKLRAEADAISAAANARVTAEVRQRAEAEAAAETVARKAHDEHVLRLRRFAALSGIAYSCWDVAAPWQRVLLDHLVHARTA